MVNPVPLSKAHSAFTALTGIRMKGIEPDQFSLARFERDARESMNVDPVMSQQLLGVIAACKWDVDGVDRAFSKAVDLGGGHAVIANWARAFRDLNDLERASILIEEASNLAPEALMYLQEAISNNFTAGRWAETENLLSLLEKRSKSIDEYLLRAREIIEISSRMGLRSSTVANVVRVCTRFLFDEKVRLVGIRDLVETVPGEESLYFELFVRESAERVQELDERLTPLLFDQVPDLQLGLFGASIEVFPDVSA